MKNKFYKIILVILTLILTFYIYPFIANGILVKTQNNSGPPLLIINSYGLINVKSSSIKIDDSGLYTLKPLDSQRGPMRPGKYIIHGAVSGIRESDGSSYFYEYEIQGILPISIFYVLSSIMCVLVLSNIFLIWRFYHRKTSVLKLE